MSKLRVRDVSENYKGICIDYRKTFLVDANGKELPTTEELDALNKLKKEEALLVLGKQEKVDAEAIKMVYNGLEVGDNKPRIIAIEGTDGSGKETQTSMLLDKLSGRSFKRSYPNYESAPGKVVSQYLAGNYGETADSVSPYLASTLYAVDRALDYKSNWEEIYLRGRLKSWATANETYVDYIVMDRYVPSNIIHQACKINDPVERQKFIDWNNDFEYNLLGTPKPDVVIFLNMPIWATELLREDRPDKITGKMTQDIHERDKNYLERAHRTSLEVAKQQGWKVIDCVKLSLGNARESIKTPEEINKEIMELLGETE